MKKNKKQCRDCKQWLPYHAFRVRRMVMARCHKCYQIAKTNGTLPLPKGSRKNSAITVRQMTPEELERMK